MATDSSKSQGQAQAQAQASKTKRNIKPVRITYKNLDVSSAAVDAANQMDVWHKFILFDVDKADKDEILDDFIKTASPILLLPVMFTMEDDKKATFLSNCRYGPIQKFVNKKMQIKLGSGKIVKYDIVLSFLSYNDMHLDTKKCIMEILKTRLTKETLGRKSLNLGNFTTDYRLGSVYCPIHVPVVFDQIFRFSHSMLQSASSNSLNNKLPVNNLILKDNKLESLPIPEKMLSYHLSKLDLRNNNLLEIRALKPFQEFKIIELWLDGNPLCNNYSSPKDYITAVRSLLPSVQILDGQCIGQEEKMLPTYHKHFIGDKAGLVKQFLKHFFTCYDQNDRIVLNGLYDAGALFSMTVGTITTAQKQLITPFATNRNLLKFVDYARCTENLLYGPEKIIAVLRREPPTMHKMKYLDIDLIYSSNNCISVSVQGPFVYRKNDCPIMWFHRTLIIVAKEDNEFCIINDQYHIDSCPQSLLESDLSDLKVEPDDSIVPSFKPISFGPAEKYQLLKLMQELTTLNSEFSEKFLVDAKWDVRLAIKNFMQTYMNNKIPAEALRSMY